MNKLILLIGVLACLVAVQARHFSEQSAEESLNDHEFRPKERPARLRRRRWQSNYGYDYQPQPPSYYYPDRRSDRDQELIQNIYRLLEDINAYIRRTPPPPPPPPQPIYIPYPVHFPRINCGVNRPQNKTPVPEKRFPAMQDTNQNWGFVMDQQDYEDEVDGSRPISFEPLTPTHLLKRPAPQVEHGSETQATVAPNFETKPPIATGQASSSSRAGVPGMCNAAILSCCGNSGNAVPQCFANIGCLSSYSASACSKESIQRSLESFKLAYSPQ